MQARRSCKGSGYPRREIATHRPVSAARPTRCIHSCDSRERFIDAYCHLVSEPGRHAHCRKSSKGSCTAAVENQLVSSSSPPPCLQRTECGAILSIRGIQKTLPHLTPKQLADALWYFAQHDLKPSPLLMGAVADKIRSKLPQCRGQDLSNVLWAFATLKYQPTDAWWRDFERHVFGALTDMTDRELANMLWAFAVLERRPAQAQPQSQTHAEAQSQAAAGCQVDSVAVAAAASAVTAEPSASAGAGVSLLDRSPGRGWVLEPLLAHSCVGGFTGYSPTSLHLLVWSLGKLHYAPPAAWLEAFLPAAEAHFFRFTPTELANIIWALAKLGAQLPSEWLDKLLLVAQWRFPSFPARLLSIVAWSTATLNHRPQQEWLMCFEEQVRAKFLDFSGHELACVAWSLRRFGYSTRDNAVFYMLQKQQSFLAADFEILSNPRLLRQVLGWKAAAALGGREGSDTEGGEEGQGGSGGGTDGDGDGSSSSSSSGSMH